MTKVTRGPTTALYPCPVVLVSCGTGTEANIITLAWAGTLCSEPPTVGIGVRPSRHSHGLIQAGSEYVVNLPKADQVRWADHCGTVSGRDEDKWVTCDFTRASGTEVEVPLIAECPINLECRVTQTVSLGSHDVFLGQVIAVHMDEEVLDDDGSLSVAKADLLTTLSGQYHRIGEMLGPHGFSEEQ